MLKCWSELKAGSEKLFNASVFQNSWLSRF